MLKYQAMNYANNILSLNLTLMIGSRCNVISNINECQNFYPFLLSIYYLLKF